MQYLVAWYSGGYVLAWLATVLPIAVAGKRALPMGEQTPAGALMLWLAVGCAGLQLPIYLGVIMTYRLQSVAWLKLAAKSGGLPLVMQQNPNLYYTALVSAAAVPIGVAGALFYLALRWRQRGRA